MIIPQAISTINAMDVLGKRNSSTGNDAANKKSTLLTNELNDLDNTNGHLNQPKKNIGAAITNSSGGKMVGNLYSTLKYHAEVIRAHPHILVITMLIFSVLCVSGLVLIFFVANTQEAEVQDDALDLAVETGQWFSDQLDRAILPLFSMAQFVSELEIFHPLPDKIGPPGAPGSLPFLPPLTEEKGITHRNVTGVCDNPMVLDRFHEIATTIKKNAKMRGVLVSINLAPYAVVCMIHPLNNTEDFEPPIYMDNTEAIGLDLLTDKSRRFIAEATIPKEDVGVAGPLKLNRCSGCDPSATVALIARLPITMEGKELVLNGEVYPKWGFVTSLINWKALIDRSDIHSTFSDKGLRFQLTRTDTITDQDTGMTSQKTVILAESPDFGLGDFPTVSTALDTTNNEWKMTVEYDLGTTIRWKPWSIAATVLFSLCIAALASTILIQKQSYTKMEKKYMEDLAQPQKLRLRMYLEESAGEGPTREVEEVIRDEKPIADVFPNTTVLFADIAGFTAWSSEREPTQVFILLQAIFYAFDRIARKRGVFKVENIGDSYVAVTGVPDPQTDHVMRMAKFARECLMKMTELTRMLEKTLGPDTSELGMRFGLHSGPVTAGVLVGERSRFQLFGDTMNTASRIESSGEKNRIHLSQNTADSLVQCGKAHWIKPRKDIVTAKGKGLMQTYWLLDGENKNKLKKRLTGSDENNNNNSDDCDSLSLPCSEQSEQDIWGGDEQKVLDISRNHDNDKIQRLVEWQVDSMVKLLKQIIAKRKRDTRVSLDLQDPSKKRPSSTTVLDEVKEVITLPRFDNQGSKNNKKAVNPDSVYLNPSVISQLRGYVTEIANLYHKNPFHNFEHASHVTMSVHKLLNRIVTPEEVDYKQQSAKAIAADMHTYTFGITSDPLTHFAVVLSALIHDVDHTGVSNGQLAKEHPELATKYRNQSIAEQNSVDIAWDILMSAKYIDLQQCIFADQVELDRFRQLIVNVVLATDIFDKELKTLRNLRWDKAFHAEDGVSCSVSSRTQSSEEESSLEALKWHDTNRKATIVIEHIIQASDVAHTMQHWHIYKKWNEKLFQEMYLAYKMGRSPNDPSEGWYKGELWFFDNYVLPLANKLEECGVFGVASDECLFNALENRREWSLKGKEVVAEMIANCQKLRLGAVPQAVQEDDEEEAEEEDEIV